MSRPETNAIPDFDEIHVFAYFYCFDYTPPSKKFPGMELLTESLGVEALLTEYSHPSLQNFNPSLKNIPAPPYRIPAPPYRIFPPFLTEIPPLLTEFPPLLTEFQSPITEFQCLLTESQGVESSLQNPKGWYPPYRIPGGWNPSLQNPQEWNMEPLLIERLKSALNC